MTVTQETKDELRRLHGERAAARQAHDALLTSGDLEKIRTEWRALFQAEFDAARALERAVDRHLIPLLDALGDAP